MRVEFSMQFVGMSKISFTLTSQRQMTLKKKDKMVKVPVPKIFSNEFSSGLIGYSEFFIMFRVIQSANNEYRSLDLNPIKESAQWRLPKKFTGSEAKR